MLPANIARVLGAAIVVASSREAVDGVFMDVYIRLCGLAGPPVYEFARPKLCALVDSERKLCTRIVPGWHTRLGQSGIIDWANLAHSTPVY